MEHQLVLHLNIWSEHYKMSSKETAGGKQ